jgi:hypothetical protein
MIPHQALILWRMLTTAYGTWRSGPVGTGPLSLESRPAFEGRQKSKINRASA